MKYLQLDFSNYRTEKRNNRWMLIVVLLIVVISILVLQHRQLLDQIAEHELTIDVGGYATLSQRSNNTDIQHERDVARQVLRALNLPWTEMLNAFEIVHGQDVNIRLLSLHPNPDRSQIEVRGVASDFHSLMEYVSKLHKQPVFVDVMLVKQERMEMAEDEGLMFTLKAQWSI